VEGPVEDEELAEVVVPHDALMDVGELGDSRVAEVGQRLGQRQRLQSLAHPVKNVELCRVEPGTRAPLFAAVLGEAFGLEDPQRLAHRQPAGAEPLGDLLLPDPLPGSDLAGEDRVAQVRSDARAGGAGPGPSSTAASVTTTRRPRTRLYRRPGRTPCRRG
jgi:hypothetical protein